MHQHRLVGGLACMGALLALLSSSSLFYAPRLSAAPVPSASITASPAPQPSATPTTSPAKPELTTRQRRLRRIARRRRLVVRVARRQLGVPYVWGGASRSGFDCSGLAMYVFKRVGVSLAHGATMQARRGKRVSLHDLRPGDLLFFGTRGYYHHVGIYVGGGRMIDAPRPGLRVRVIRPWGAAAARRLLHL
jgi:peptidoglycan DL-endopeptidase CwlO